MKLVVYYPIISSVVLIIAGYTYMSYQVDEIIKKFDYQNDRLLAVESFKINQRIDNSVIRAEFKGLEKLINANDSKYSRLCK